MEPSKLGMIANSINAIKHDTSISLKVFMHLDDANVSMILALQQLKEDLEDSKKETEAT